MEKGAVLPACGRAEKGQQYTEEEQQRGKPGIEALRRVLVRAPGHKAPHGAHVFADNVSLVHLFPFGAQHRGDLGSVRHAEGEVKGPPPPQGAQTGKKEGNARYGAEGHPISAVRRKVLQRRVQQSKKHRGRYQGLLAEVAVKGPGQPRGKHIKAKEDRKKQKDKN